MKIRDLILAVMIAGMLVSTGVLVAFATNGISDVKGISSVASSEEMIGNAIKNLNMMAVDIRDSLDSHMQDQYAMVKSWAQQPDILTAARDAQGYTMKQLYEMWSAAATRVYNDGDASGDGNADNDVAPTVSRYLATLVSTTNYPEIFITDTNGFVIAASGATDDFDQGPSDWKTILIGDTPIFQPSGTSAYGEEWYHGAVEAGDGFYVSDVIFEPSINAWGISIVSQLRDPATDEYLGLIKAVYNYDAFFDQYFNVNKLDIYEAKIADVNGTILATSLKDKTKVNNPAVNIKSQFGFKASIYTNYGNIAADSDSAKSYAFFDENNEIICAGSAMSGDANRHTVMVTRKAADVSAPIDTFVANLQSNISDESSTLQRNMIIIGVAVAIILIIAAFFIIRSKVSIPMKKLTTISDKLSKGEIEGLEINIRGKDEIGRFGESFKGVLAAFNFLKDEVEKK